MTASIIPQQITAATPNVAKVVDLLVHRPPWLARDPLEVPIELYQQAAPKWMNY